MILSKCRTCGHFSDHSQGGCQVIRVDGSVCCCKGEPYLSPRKRRRIKRREWRKLTSKLCDAWGMHYTVALMLPTSMLRKRVLDIIRGKAIPDGHLSFWYHPETGEFERLSEYPGRDRFIYQHPWPLPVLSVDPQAVTKLREILYCGRVWVYKSPCFDIKALLFLQESDPVQLVHNWDMRRAMHRIYSLTLDWLRASGIDPNKLRP